MPNTNAENNILHITKGKGDNVMSLPNIAVKPHNSTQRCVSQ